MNTYLENVTPQLAKEYLKHNVRNRTVKVGEVESIARDIKRGDYRLTHQGIAFDTEGTLIDGQQRLLAVIMANQPIQILVTKDVDKDAVSAIDRGTTRSVRDSMMMGNIGESEGDRKLLRDSFVISTMNQLVACSYKKRRNSPSDALRLFEKLRPQIELVYETGIKKSKGLRQSQVFAAAVAALYCGVDAVSIARFFNVFYDADIVGCENNNIRAVLNWRRQLDDARARRMNIDRRKIYLGTQNAIYNFVNNTEVKTTVVPANPRYDVRQMVVETVGE